MANSLSASRSFWRSSSSVVSDLPTASVHSSFADAPVVVRVHLRQGLVEELRVQ